MSDIVFGMAGNEDIDVLVRLRLAYLREDCGDIPPARDFFAYGAWQGDEMVGVCFLLVTEKPSNLSFVNGLTGTVMRFM